MPTTHVEVAKVGLVQGHLARPEGPRLPPPGESPEKGPQWQNRPHRRA